MADLSVSPAERRLTLAALAVVVLLSALDQTVVSTAMPRIIEQLQGLSMYAWVTTAYILVAIQFEERDLVHEHPEYADYRRRVPMLIPFLRGRGSASPGTGATAHS